MSHNNKNTIQSRYFATGNSLKELGELWTAESKVKLEFDYVLHILRNRLTIDETGKDGKFPLNAESLRVLDLIIKHGETAGKQVYLHEYMKKQK